MVSRTVLILAIIALFLIFLPGSTLASPNVSGHIVQVANLSGDKNNLAFGYSVAISGNLLAVGDPYDSRNIDEAGSVTIYQSNLTGQWDKINMLAASDARAGDHFGRNLALWGDRLVVGAPFSLDYGTSPGTAYIFEKDQGGPNTWGLVAKLTASEIFPCDNFGWAVAVYSDTVAVGAYATTPGGVVYIYERDAGGPGAWGETAQLFPDAPVYGAGFGESVSLDDDLLAVGAYAGGDYSGYAYIFQQLPDSDQWQRLTRFRASDTSDYHYFGYSLALDDYTLLAGAPGADGLTGAAYIFTADPAEPDTWIEQAQLTASDGAMGDFFALQLDLSGDYAWIGSPSHSSAEGTIYAYYRNHVGPDQWGEVSHLTGSDTRAGDEFGYWTSIDGQLAAVGAPFHAPTGAAYVFDLNAPWRIHLPLVTR
jgi:hypothetical protein